ncbi:MAG: hypothetical protein A2017_12750 [Lentisphaerae bacterium GWF2_44_16]|nr:MAG: hypothetical protein A2017_12750 [Lentisphaerae bacterium GWF2_44_16]
MKKLPVIINNFNRYAPLKALVAWLLDSPDDIEIVIIDNHSTYPKTLRLYEHLRKKVDIQYLKHNVGHLAPRIYVESKLAKDERFIVSDPDLVPHESCPRDIVSLLNELMDTYSANKVGAGLGLDDIPDCYPFKKQVIRWERSLSRGLAPCGKAEYFQIDTTFALYRDKSFFGKADEKSLRACAPYIFRHVDWYIDPLKLGEEYEYYLNTGNSSSSYGGRVKRYFEFNNLLNTYRGEHNDEKILSLLKRGVFELTFHDYKLNLQIRFGDDGEGLLEGKVFAGFFDYELISGKALAMQFYGGNYSRALLNFSDESFESFEGVSDYNCHITGKIIS